MDTIAPDLISDEESARTSGRTSARSSRVEVLSHPERRRSWTLEQKRYIVAESLGSELTPASAEAQLQIRLVTPSETVRGILEKVVAGRARVEYMSAAEPVRMLSVEGFEREVVRFTTDIPYLSNWGRPLLIGPGSILVAHTDGERVLKRELEEAVELYARLARTLLGRERS